jgi:hypothetical protein
MDGKRSFGQFGILRGTLSIRVFVDCLGALKKVPPNDQTFFISS